MLTDIKTIYVLIVTIFIFNGCSTGERYYNKPNFTQQQYVKLAQRPKLFLDLNGAITELSNQILINNIKSQSEKKIVLTTFVNLDDFKKTSTFGRVASESMINELHIRNFKIIDIRGQNNISINRKGEFHITRDIGKLKQKINDSYVLIGTYSKFDQNSIAINARIMDVFTGDVISSGRVIYTHNDCQLFELCTEKIEKIKIIKG